MTDECISLLRQRMIEDMSLRNFGEKTQKDYIRAVKNLTIFLPRCLRLGWYCRAAHSVGCDGSPSAVRGSRSAG
jgi:hypothetical protein